MFLACFACQALESFFYFIILWRRGMADVDQFGLLFELATSCSGSGLMYRFSWFCSLFFLSLPSVEPFVFLWMDLVWRKAGVI